MTGPLAAFGAADRFLLLKVNRDWTAESLDALMPVVTDLHRVPWFLYGVVPAALALWLWKGRKRALKVLVVAALAVAAGDLVGYRVLKPLVARPRPGREVSGVVERAPVRGALGFPSNHATNTAAAAAVLTVAYPGGAYAFWAVAALVAYSRVYVGAHYPGDVLAGLLLGAAIGWPWALLMLGGDGGGGSARKKKGR
ncbi:MAG: phosphatase PAP2 family protein [Elusimicrobia bacterium]|nr:phosphatase PAP2 family protein [Elusimicrobiota bacterium]